MAKKPAQRVQAWGAGLSGIALVAMATLTAPVASAAAPHADLLPATTTVVSPKALASSNPTGPLPSTSPWTFEVVLPSQNPAGLAQYAQSVSTPGSSNYQHYLTHSQLMNQFGPSASLEQTVSHYLRQQGFTVQSDGQMLNVSGTVGQVNALFATQLEQFNRPAPGPSAGPGPKFVAPAGPITIPSTLRLVQGIAGLTTDTAVPQISNHLVPAAQMPVVHYAPPGQMGPAPGGSTSTSSNDGMTVTAQLLSNGPRVPGMAVRYLITVTENGQPDPNAGFDGLAGPFQGSSSVVDSTLTNANGQFIVDFTLSQAQAVSLALTVADFNSAGEATSTTDTVQLPTAHFQGPDALTVPASSLFGSSASGTLVAPWNPSSNSVVTAVHGTTLSQQTAQHGPADLAVYTAGNVVNVSQGDVDEFAQQFGLTPPNVSVAYSGPNACTVSSCGEPTMFSIEAELSLDLQMMETAAPGSNIQVYEAGSLRSALNQVITQDTAKVFSISYGAGELAEQAYAAGAQQDWDMLAEEANVEGITITVSAGDSAAFEGAEEGYDQPMTSYPANSPYVSALGGTEVSVNPSGQVNQVALWGGNLGSEISNQELLSFLSLENMMGGGGYSLLEPTPVYQQGLVPPGDGRANPDFSLPASVVTPGYFIYIGGTPYFAGGTSASAPLFAGFVGDLTLALNHALGNVNPLIYSLARLDPNLFSAVAYGNNGVEEVTPGYNAVTGWGQINFGRLLADLTSPAPAPVPMPHPGPGPGPGPGGPGHP